MAADPQFSLLRLAIIIAVTGVLALSLFSFGAKEKPVNVPHANLREKETFLEKPADLRRHSRKAALPPAPAHELNLDEREKGTPTIPNAPVAPPSDYKTPLHELFDVEIEDLEWEHEEHGKGADDIHEFRKNLKLLLDPAAADIFAAEKPRLFLFHFGAGDGEAIEWFTRRVKHGNDFRVFALEADKDGYKAKFDARMKRMADDSKLDTRGDHNELPLEKRLEVFWGLATGSVNGTCPRPGPGVCIDFLDFVSRRVTRDDYVVVILGKPREQIDFMIHDTALRDVQEKNSLDQLVDELFLECELGDTDTAHYDCVNMVSWVRGFGMYAHEWRQML